MKRLTVATVALSALVIGLTACGSDDHSSAADANGLRRNGSAVATSAPAAPSPSSAPASAPPEVASPTTESDSSVGLASRTTCEEFRKLDVEGEKSLMDRILAENPGSKFDGSPNVALGTAKLMCLAKSEADKPVPVAIGMITE
ncbi:hypothetical protein AB0L57_09190 [Nocardia sp. NPDC052254]|uniref:hypothetical protein n=1 Tax=Nocardia sp. NPDC052254 TaxID=3155681 RepID=UPI003442A3F2